MHLIVDIFAGIGLVTVVMLVFALVAFVTDKHPEL